MPANIVAKYGADGERLWKLAKKQAKKHNRSNDYPYIVGIFKTMVKNKSKSSESYIDDIIDIIVS